MIVLCPKAFSANDGLSHERDFLKYVLSRKGQKAFIANECWETFRFKLINSSSDIDSVNDTIAHFRGMFRPEDERIGDDFDELPPQNSYSSDELIDKTRDLLSRRWADIDLFITTIPETFEDITKNKGIEMQTLQEFFISWMDNDRSRKVMQEFWYKIEADKW